MRVFARKLDEHACVRRIVVHRHGNLSVKDCRVKRDNDKLFRSCLQSSHAELVSASYCKKDPETSSGCVVVLQAKQLPEFSCENSQNYPQKKILR